MAFHDIPGVLEAVLDSHTAQEADSLEAILQADTWARAEAHLLISRKANATPFGK